jgi:4-amino-4-deoxy-L-arabinose transferase-like glycosyltransferase
VLFWRLGAATFWDPDEAHYAQTTRELIQSGDWLAPFYNHQPFFDKPVLFHVLQALPMSLFGPTEFAARLVPALAALVLILTTWWLGAVLASAEVGVLAAMLLTVSPAVFALSRYAILDTLFTAFLFGGVSLLTVAALQDRPRLQYGGYILLAAAALTKGPLAIVLSGLAFLIAIAMSADARRRLLGLRWVVGLAIVAFLSAPWFLYMLWRFRGDFVHGYLLNENLSLFTSPPYQNQPGWWFYLQIIALGFLPWTLVLIGRAIDDVRLRRGVDTFDVLLWSWAIAIVGFFSVSRFKLDHYVFPALPALCLLAARAWVESVEGRPGQAGRVGLGRKTFARVGVLAAGPILVVAGITAAILMQRLDLPFGAIAAPASLILAGGVLLARSIFRSVPRVPWSAFAAFGVTYAVVILLIGPALERWKVVPDVAQWVVTHSDAATRVGTYRLNRWDPALRFYVERQTTLLETPEQAAVFFADPEPFFCVMPGSEFDNLVQRGLAIEIVYTRSGMWATSGRALWRQGATFTDFVVVTARHRANVD